MKRVLSYFLLSATIILTVSCADTRKPEQLEKTSIFLEELDSIESLTINNRIDSSVYYAQRAEAVEQRIKKNYFTDTVNREFAMKMDAFKVMRRKFKPLNFDYLNLINGCQEMRSSLTKLSADIDQGNNSRDKYDEFIEFEGAKLHQLNLLCESYVASKKECIKTFNELYEELNAFSMMLLEIAKEKKQ